MTKFIKEREDKGVNNLNAILKRFEIIPKQYYFLNKLPSSLDLFQEKKSTFILLSNIIPEKIEIDYEGHYENIKVEI